MGGRLTLRLTLPDVISYNFCAIFFGMSVGSSMGMCCKLMTSVDFAPRASTPVLVAVLLLSSEYSDKLLNFRCFRCLCDYCVLCDALPSRYASWLLRA